MTRQPLALALALGVALLAASGAGAQRLGGIGGLPGQMIGGGFQPVPPGVPPSGILGNPLDATSLAGARDPTSLLDLRRQRLRALVRENRAALDVDDHGDPVRRDEVIALDPSAAVLATAKRAGFTPLREERVDSLGLALVVLAPPKGKGAKAGLKMLREIDASGHFEFNHLYEPAGAAVDREGTARASSSSSDAAIGMIDGGVGAHRALAAATIEQRGFAPGAPKASGHGTAIASLLVGSDGRFVGAARGRALLVADVYGGQAAAGSAEAIVRAMGWLAERRVGVITVSLVGPPNQLLERGVAALQARGVLVVAAVGNDGPAAPPQYPASYPGVIAVTGVDAHGRALLEAGRATHLDFAAPGADMAAALPGRGYGVVRGTSFATPLVAARLTMAGGDGAAALRAVSAEAAPGKGSVGRGIVCEACRIDPKWVGAKQ